MSQPKRNPSRLLFFRPQVSRQQRLAAARDQADEYRLEITAPADTAPEATASEATVTQNGAEEPPQTLEDWRDLVGRRIEDAMRRGEFDHLRNHGKPLDVRRDPFVPEEKQMAFTLLKNNDMAPEWIVERKEVLHLKERFRAEVQAVAHEALTQWAAGGDETRRQQLRALWAHWIERWTGEVEDINWRIQILNFKQPSVHLEIIKLRLDDELRHAGAARTLSD